jgi:hypothetical protein
VLRPPPGSPYSYPGDTHGWWTGQLWKIISSTPGVEGLRSQDLVKASPKLDLQRTFKIIIASQASSCSCICKTEDQMSLRRSWTLAVNRVRRAQNCEVAIFSMIHERGCVRKDSLVCASEASKSKAGRHFCLLQIADRTSSRIATATKIVPRLYEFAGLTALIVESYHTCMPVPWRSCWISANPSAEAHARKGASVMGGLAFLSNLPLETYNCSVRVDESTP